jgi:hypothetical protein
MPTYHFERESRTPYSESFIIEADGDEVGRVDIHYQTTTAYATLCVPTDLADEEIEELISEIDERLVMSWDPLRDDFIVTVWAGREVGVFSEADDEDEELDEDEEDEDLEAENGHR